MPNQYTKKADAKAKRQRSQNAPTGKDKDDFDAFLRNNPNAKQVVAEAIREGISGAVFEVRNPPATPLMNKADEKAKSVPHFTLLPGDNFTPILVKTWIELAVTMGANEEKVAEARLILQRIQKWRADNSLKCKTPD